LLLLPFAACLRTSATYARTTSLPFAPSLPRSRASFFGGYLFPRRAKGDMGGRHQTWRALGGSETASIMASITARRRNHIAQRRSSIACQRST